MKKIDIISSVCGNKKIVEECIDSWTPLLSECNLHIYNNKVSDIDGTTTYLEEMQRKHKYNLIQDGRTLSHSEAFDVLIKQTQSNWILHLDSDVRILDIHKFSNIFSLINNESSEMHGIVQKNHFTPKFTESLIKDNMVFKLTLPRAYTWIILFKKSLYVENNLSFSPMRLHIDGNFERTHTHIIRDGLKQENFSYPIKTNDVYREEEKQLPIKVLAVADTGWQLYWESNRRGTFFNFPKDIIKSCEHKGGSSVTWMRDNNFRK